MIFHILMPISSRPSHLNSCSELRSWQSRMKSSCRNRLEGGPGIAMRTNDDEAMLSVTHEKWWSKRGKMGLHGILMGEPRRTSGTSTVFHGSHGPPIKEILTLEFSWLVWNHQSLKMDQEDLGESQCIRQHDTLKPPMINHWVNIEVWPSVVRRSSDFLWPVLRHGNHKGNEWWPWPITVTSPGVADDSPTRCHGFYHGWIPATHWPELLNCWTIWGTSLGQQSFGVTWCRMLCLLEFDMLNHPPYKWIQMGLHGLKNTIW